MSDCIFCLIIRREEIAEIVMEWSDAIAIVPRGPVVEGHTLVIPKLHVSNWTENPFVSGLTMMRAAELEGWGRRPSNLITSAGQAATQSVFHLHLHIVPRAENDGLALPWYSGKSRKQVSS